MLHIAERNRRGRIREKCFITGECEEFSFFLKYCSVATVQCRCSRNTYWNSFILEVTVAAENIRIRTHERPENGKESK